MRLTALTRTGVAELLRQVSEHARPIAVEDVPPDWLEEIEPSIDVSAITRAVADWDGDPWLDGQNAIDLHRKLALPRRVAAQKNLWPWLAACAFGEYTWRRYPPDEFGRFNLDRVRTDVVKNAIGRLWWTAEQTRVENPGQVCRALGLADTDDEYVFTRRIFRVQSVHQELTYRAGLMTRPFVAAFLSLVERMEVGELDRRDVSTLAWESNLLFSSVVLDAYSAFGDPDYPAAIAPDACAELRDFLADALFGVSARPTTKVREDVRPAVVDAVKAGGPRRAAGVGLRGLFSRFRRRGAEDDA